MHDLGDAPPDASDATAHIAADLEELHLGDLSHRDADGSLLWAIALRQGRVGEWLVDHGVDAADVETAFSGSGWT